MAKAIKSVTIVRDEILHVADPQYEDMFENGNFRRRRRMKRPFRSAATAVPYHANALFASHHHHLHAGAHHHALSAATRNLFGQAAQAQPPPPPPPAYAPPHYSARYDHRWVSSVISKFTLWPSPISLSLYPLSIISNYRSLDRCSLPSALHIYINKTLTELCVGPFEVG